MSILNLLQDRFRRALVAVSDQPDQWLDLVRQSQDAKFGDYQANFAMPLGKRLGRPPRQVAAEVLARLDVADLCHPPEVAGPGFINLRLRDEWLAGRLAAAAGDERLGIPRAGRPRTYVIDFSAPNVAKPMHVGHIRSTVLGDALCRMLRFLGHQVTSDNHIGDWGTQFGMILYGYKHFLDAEAYRTNPVQELARLYRLVRKLADEPDRPHLNPIAEEEGLAAGPGTLWVRREEEIADAVLAETAKLHAGDAENRRLWQEFMPCCLEEIERIYRRLDVHFDCTLGESFYNDMLPGVVEDLLRRGIARTSDGAVCVFLEGEPAPMIVRKQDGAFLYATTDLATIRYRLERWRPDAILYVVDHRQAMHFRQLFAAARKCGWEDVELAHVSFGTVLGNDGRPFRTREGDTVGLEGLLDEAVRRAAAIVAANDDAKPDGPELSAEERARVAETVGIAALKYADLAQNRTSDYVFSYDKMLAMNGNTATYMQYAYARVRSIFAKGKTTAEAVRAAGGPIALGTPAERALGLELLRFAEALELALVDYRPSQLTTYLLALANRYFTFYEQCPVLAAETAELRQSRLLLCDLVARTIQKGLELLGIRVVERM
jgi:arginyl-tRNA synthetase